MTNVDSDTGVLAGEQRMLIDGELRFTDSGALFDVVHPASEQVVGQATDGTVADIERATTAARRAFDTTDWSRDVEFRYHCLRQLQDALTAEQERLRPHRDHRGGLPVSVSGSQIESPIAEVGHWAEHGRTFEYLVDTGCARDPLGPARRKIQYDPVGRGRCDHPVERALLPQHRRDGSGVDGRKHGGAQAGSAHPVVGQRAGPHRRGEDRHPGRGVQRGDLQCQRGRRGRCRRIRGWT